MPEAMLPDEAKNRIESTADCANRWPPEKPVANLSVVLAKCLEDLFLIIVDRLASAGSCTVIVANDTSLVVGSLPIVLTMIVEISLEPEEPPLKLPPPSRIP